MAFNSYGAQMIQHIGLGGVTITTSIPYPSSGLGANVLQDESSDALLDESSGQLLDET